MPQKQKAKDDAKQAGSAAQPKRTWQLPWLAGASVLSPDEVEGIRENLMIGLQVIEENMDKFVTATNNAKAEAIIWSTIDDEDNAFIADLMIQAGMRIPAAGEVVRHLANAAWELRLGNILVPRFVHTWNHYRTYGLGRLWK